MGVLSGFLDIAQMVFSGVFGANDSVLRRNKRFRSKIGLRGVCLACAMLSALRSKTEKNFKILKNASVAQNLVSVSILLTKKYDLGGKCGPESGICSQNE